MNKKLLGIFCVAAASLAASAQVPTTYNYQGVCGTENADVEVVFDILNNGQVVYSEIQTVRTNRDGAFTALVGNGDAFEGSWNMIDWANGDYSLQTSVDGKVVANCPMVAVPYATVAERVLGLEDMRAEVADALEEAQAANLKAETYYNSLKAETEDTFSAIDERINDNWAQTEEAVHEILGGFEVLSSGIDAELTEIKAQIANMDENTVMANELIDTLLERVDDNADAIDAVKANLAAEVQTLKAQMDETTTTQDESINELRINLSKVAESFDNQLTENMEAIQDAFTEIDKKFENVDMMTGVLQQMEEDIADNTDAIDAVKANLAAEVQTLKAQMDETTTTQDGSINELREQLNRVAMSCNNQREEDMTSIQDMFDQLNNDLQAQNTELGTLINQMVDKIQDLQDQIDELNQK